MPEVDLIKKLNKAEKKIRKIRGEIEKLRDDEYQEVLKWSYLNTLRYEREKVDIS